MDEELSGAGDAGPGELAPSGFDRLAAIENVREKGDALAPIAQRKLDDASALVVRLLGDAAITVGETTYEAKSINRERLLDDLPELMRLTVEALQDELREYDQVLSASPLRSKQAAERVARRLHASELKHRSEEDATALISSVAGVNDVDITQLESAANAADVLRHAISVHQKLAIEEASALAAPFQRAMGDALILEVPQLGRLSVKAFVGWKRARARRKIAVVRRVMAAAKDGKVSGQDLRRIADESLKTISLGSALTLDAKPLSSLSSLPRRTFADPLNAIREGLVPHDESSLRIQAADALRFLKHWDSALEHLEAKTAERTAGLQQQIDKGIAVGI